MRGIYILLIPFCLILCIDACAQGGIIRGRVTDAETGEGIPLVKITFRGILKSNATDFEGYYKITISHSTSYLTAFCVGYEKLTVLVNKHAKEQVINFVLKRASYTKNQASDIKNGQAEALEIMRKVIEKKNSHDKDKLNSYAYEAYTKNEVYLDDLTEKFKNRKVFQPFKFIFNSIDTVSEMRPFLPFFITETVSDFHHQKGPLGSREIIKASKVSGVNDLSIAQFLGTTYVSINIYDNTIELLDRQFISPASSLGLGTYSYFLTDSQVIDHFKCYKIKFVPKQKRPLLPLEGEMWIADSVFAIKQIHMGMTPGSDVNLVHTISLYDDFVPVKDSVWMLKQEKLVIHFTKRNGKPGLVAQKAATYKNFVVDENEAILDSVFKKESRDVTIRDSANMKSEQYWAAVRKGSPSFDEKQVYSMIDTLGNTRAVRNYINLFQALLLGYVDVGPVSIGDIYSFPGLNSVQGPNLQFGMRTNRKFSQDFRFGGYLGYGFLNQKAKYGAEFQLFSHKDPLEYFSVTYRNDVVYRSTYDNYYVSAADFFTTDGLRRYEAGNFIPFKIIGIRELRLNYYREFKSGYSLIAGFTNRYLNPLGRFNFSYQTGSDALQPNTTITSVTATEFILTQRFAWQENFLSNDFGRYSLGSKYPILTVQFAVGIKQFMDGGFNYQRLIVSLTDTRLLGPLGKLRWSVEAGKIFGNLPFLLLAMPEASETYISSFGYFNTIQRYQYVADGYVKVMFDHHLQGLIFNQIPGIKKLKLREVWGLKMWWGGLSNANRYSNYADLAENPADTGMIRLQIADKIPLVEINAGIENIFKFVRIDAVWRATQLNPMGTRFSFRYGNFGLRASFQFQF